MAANECHTIANVACRGMCVHGCLVPSVLANKPVGACVSGVVVMVSGPLHSPLMFISKQYLCMCKGPPSTVQPLLLIW